MHTLLSLIADACEKSTTLLERTEDYGAFERRLEALSTALVHAALQLRLAVQDIDEATGDLVTDVFYEVFLSLPPDARPGFQGTARFHSSATMSIEGVSPCQDWKVQSSTAPWQHEAQE